MKLKLTAALIFLSLFCLISAYSETTRTITDKNEFGGPTQETVYVNGDEYYNKLGLEKSVAYYGSDNKIKKVEYNYTPKISEEKGYNKSTEFYNDNQKVYSAEIIHTEGFIKKENYTKHFEFYDDKGQKTRIDYFYTDDYASKNGYNKASIVLVKGFVREWDYYYIDSYVEKYGVYQRIDIYVTDPYGNSKVSGTKYYDKDNKEVVKKEQ